MSEFIKEYLESKVIVVCRGIAEEEIVTVAQECMMAVSVLWKFRLTRKIRIHLHQLPER